MVKQGLKDTRAVVFSWKRCYRGAMPPICCWTKPGKNTINARYTTGVKTPTFDFEARNVYRHKRFFRVFNNSQVLWRKEDSDKWQLLGDERIEIIPERCSVNDNTLRFFLRAKVPHFSDWILAKSVYRNNPYHDECTWRRLEAPGKRQVGFANATDRPVIFVVVPTKSKTNDVKSAAAGVETAAGGVNASMELDPVQTILPAALQPQVLGLLV